MKHTKNMFYKESSESTELTLFLVNDGGFYESRILPICKTLSKHVKKGNYSVEKAADLFYIAANEGAKLYCKRYASHKEAPHIFDVTCRYTVAVDLENEFHDFIFELSEV